MTLTGVGAARRPPMPSPGPGLVLASRGDALTPYLRAALARRYPITGLLEPELSQVQRLAVAAGSFRPSRTRWVEQYWKSPRGYRLRSANAARQQQRLARPTDPVLQVHALFEVRDAPAMLYVDCTHAQSAEHWPAWNPLRGKALEQWYRRESQAYHDAAHLFAFSRRTEQSLVLDYGVPAHRVSVVGAGVNLISPPARREPSSGPATILFIGNDFARKGGHTLLAAFRQVRRQFPAVRLQLVGTDPGIESQPGVDVLGRIHDRARVSDLYRRATVFCLPSVFDPLPLVLLEAMAHGLPAVTTASCGIPDVVTDGVDGVLVAPGDPQALARSLIRLLADPARADRLGAAGRERVEQHFTWDRVVDRMAPVIDELVL